MGVSHKMRLIKRREALGKTPGKTMLDRTCGDLVESAQRWASNPRFVGSISALVAIR